MGLRAVSLGVHALHGFVRVTRSRRGAQGRSLVEALQI
jgi:hypothetical protein